jgi:hypothetical protein
MLAADVTGALKIRNSVDHQTSLFDGDENTTRAKVIFKGH